MKTFNISSLSLRNRLFLSFGVLTLFILIIFSFVEIFGIPKTLYFGQYKRSRIRALQTLNLVADLKKILILEWLNEWRNALEIIAKGPIRPHLIELLRAAGRYEGTGNGGRVPPERLRADENYQKVQAFLRLMQNIHARSENIEIVDPRNGRIVVSTREEDVGGYLPGKIPSKLPGPFGDESVTMEKAPNHSMELVISHAIYVPSGDGQGRENAAVLRMRINPDRIIKPMLHTGGGLGRTGEVVLVDQEGRILMPLKFALADGTKAEPLHYRITAKPALLAAGGNEGSTIAKDYRGASVFAAYRYVRLSPEIGWGMVVKIDRSELFEDFYRRLKDLGFMMIALLFLFSIIAAYLARTFTLPIQQLVDAVKKVQSGDLFAMAPNDLFGEAGVLGRAFNSMMRRIRDWHQELNEAVKVRTGELTQKNLELMVEVETREKAETALERNEKLYRSVVETAMDAMISVNQEGKILSWNQAAERVFGYKEADILGESSTLLMPVRFHKEHREGMKRLAEGGESKIIGKTLELQGVRKEGEEFPLELSLAQWRSREGLFFTGIVRDLTDRKELERQFLQAQKMESIGRFAGGIAHDYNNLLTTILGYSDLYLLQHTSGDADYEMIQVIRVTAERATRLTRQLLTISKREILEPVVLNLNEVVEEMAGLFAPLVGEDLVFRFHLDPDLRRVKADPSQIEQVLMNLVVNAKDAMPEGGEIAFSSSNIRLDDRYARSHFDLAPGDYVQLSVSDTGPGMSPEIQEHIFEPFYTTKQEGTGLGLSTTFSIVEHMNGHIFVYSELGVGTTFKLYFPMVEEEEGESSGPRSNPGELYPGGGETILVVEDDEHIRKLVQHVLPRLGYTVLTAGNGEEALDQVKGHKGKINLLLTDVVMPGKNGPEVAEELKRDNPEMKVIFMSGYADDRIAQSSIFQQGAFFLSKPFVVSDLSLKIREALNDQGNGEDAQ